MASRSGDIASKDRLHLTAQIVCAYVSFNKIPMQDVPMLIRGIHTALGQTGTPPRASNQIKRNFGANAHRLNELQAPKKILSRNRRSTALENQATFTNKIASNVKDSSSGGKREEVGLWLRERREARGLTQRALAEMIGSVYFTYISQVELGQSRIIPERWPQWADALDIELSVFAMRMLEAYDPIAYRMIFSSD